VDILIVAYLIYNVIMLIRKTNSYRLAQGVLGAKRQSYEL